jgi:16S rRNA (uracil1498-N3)-methyltransferase
VASRFFVPPEQITHHRFVLLGSEAHHASVVLRKRIGETIDLFDGKNLSYQARIESISPERVEGTILSQRDTGSERMLNLTLYQALIKGPKWDWLVEKACEIGVTKLVPVLTARTVVKPSRGEANDRWKRIALAASKQCGRSQVMEILSPIPFSEAIATLPKDALVLIPWEKETQRSIRQALQFHPSIPSSVALFIGPEGGWETEEVTRAQRQGAIPVRLGPTLLRSETAGVVAATLVLSELGLYS